MKSINFTKTVGLIIILIVTCTLSAAAKDDWIQVESKNFNLIGNASEKDIRRVAVKMEQFRETFRIAFSGLKLNSPVPTNIVVFKSDSNYRPFKPVRADGKPDDMVAGYFQPGEDVNYITLAAGGSGDERYETIFHEIVHSLINTNFGSGNVPKWFNEGLAEYYSTFTIKNDQVVTLGIPQAHHLDLLRNVKMMSLDDLFQTKSYNIRGGHSRSIFYAQSWALVHFLIQSGQSDGLSKFLTLSMKNEPDETAFRESFGKSYAEMEKEIARYARRSTFNTHVLTLKEKFDLDASMAVRPLSEAVSNAYLGDLLYRINRHDDAEPFLTRAVELDRDLGIANSSLGMVKIRQRKYDDAKRYLDRAIEVDPANHLALYRYAYLLSREGRDEFGINRGFPDEVAQKMHELLKGAIAAKPDFTESHDLFAFVSLSSNKDLDTAVNYMLQAVRTQPGNDRYRMRIAEIFVRQRKFDDAAAIAQRIASSADSEELRSRASGLVAHAKQAKEVEERNAAVMKQIEEARNVSSAETSGPPRLGRRISPEEAAKRDEENRIRNLNIAIRPSGDGEQRVIGKIQKIDCRGQSVSYTVKTENGILVLTSKGFDDLGLTVLTDGWSDFQLGCDSKLESATAVLFYKPSANQRAAGAGELVAIDFVPENFRFVDVDSQVDNGPVFVATDQNNVPPPRPLVEEVTRIISTDRPSAEEMEALQRKAILEQIRQNLQKPKQDELRVLGTIDRSECSNRGMFFFFRVNENVIKLSAPTDRQLGIGTFTPAIENVKIGCLMKSLDVPVVVVYKNTPDKKNKTAGIVQTMEFVPKSFTFED